MTTVLLLQAQGTAVTSTSSVQSSGSASQIHLLPFNATELFAEPTNKEKSAAPRMLLQLLLPSIDDMLKP
jgi:hypothetical protein